MRRILAPCSEQQKKYFNATTNHTSAAISRVALNGRKHGKRSLDHPVDSDHYRNCKWREDSRRLHQQYAVMHTAVEEEGSQNLDFPENKCPV